MYFNKSCKCYIKGAKIAKYLKVKKYLSLWSGHACVYSETTKKVAIKAKLIKIKHDSNMHRTVFWKAKNGKKFQTGQARYQDNFEVLDGGINTLCKIIAS
ncbi:MAG: hypothetical protein LBP54_02230 [Campylobacteraceae bacterium]|jgi:hypothetical protein|nr:hypothetical protein [Campylobacteraceae bacterium]